MFRILVDSSVNIYVQIRIRLYIYIFYSFITERLSLFFIILVSKTKNAINIILTFFFFVVVVLFIVVFVVYYCRGVFFYFSHSFYCSSNKLLIANFSDFNKVIQLFFFIFLLNCQSSIELFFYNSLISKIYFYELKQ